MTGRSRPPKRSLAEMIEIGRVLKASLEPVPFYEGFLAHVDGPGRYHDERDNPYCGRTDKARFAGWRDGYREAAKDLAPPARRRATGEGRA